MTNKLKDWSTTPASNNSTPPEGWPEGMAPSKVNDTARQNMAYIREWYEDAEWIRYDHSIASSTSSTVVISGDVTAVYVADRAIRLDQDNAKVGYVVSSIYSAPNTTVTVGGLTVSSPTIIEVGSTRSKDSMPYNTRGPGARSLIGYPPAFRYGLKLSLAADTSHDITIGVGGCRDDSDAGNITLSSAITKQIDAPWAEGTDSGGFPTGETLTANTWLYVFVISKADGTTDAGFDYNSDASSLLADATGYVYYKHVGSALLDASANILALLNNDEIGLGNCFIHLTSSITFPKPPSVDELTKVLFYGGGGGGSSTGGTPTDGGDTSFDGISALGGKKGNHSPQPYGGAVTISAAKIKYATKICVGQTGSPGTAYDADYSGEGGECGFVSIPNGIRVSGAFVSTMYPAITAGDPSGTKDGNNGGGGSNSGPGNQYFAGGGAGSVELSRYPISGSITITIGAGGNAGTSCGAGGDGACKIWI